MGTSATTESARIEFNSWEAARAAFPLFKAYAEDAQAGKKGGDFGFDLSSLEVNSGSIYFLASSSRIQNLEWQLEKVLEFAQTLTGITEFNAPVMMAADGLYWTPDE